MKKTRKSLLLLLPLLLALGACQPDSSSSLPSSQDSSVNASSPDSSSQADSSKDSSTLVSSSLPASSSSEESSSLPSSTISEPEISIAIKTPEKTELTIGESLTLEVEVQKNVENLPILFESSDEKILTVDEEGKVTAVGRGSAEVVAIVGETRSQPVSFTVKAPEIQVSIKAPEKTELTIGDSLTLEVDVQNNIDDLPILFESSDEAVLKVDSKGVVTALASGKATVTARVGEVFDTIDFTIHAPEATDIEIVLETTTLYVGQSLEVQANILPEDADQDYTVSSSNEIFVSVDGKTITAEKLTLEGESITITVTTGNGMSDSVEVTVVEKGPIMLEKAKSLLSGSASKEKGNIVSGKMTMESHSSYSENTETFDFDIHTDKNVTHYKSEGGYYPADQIITKGIEEDRLVIATQNVEGDGLLTMEEVETYDIVDEPSYNEISPAGADDAMKLPYFDSYFSNDGPFGISNFLLDGYFGNYDFGSDDALESMDLVQEGNTYTLTADYLTYNYYELSLTFTLDEEGILSSGTFEKKTYDTEEDWDTGEVTIGDIDSSTTLTFEQQTGTPEPAGDDVLDFADFYLTDFDLSFTEDYSGTKPITTTEVGRNVYLQFDGLEPAATASLDIDPIEIVSVSPSTGVEYDVYGSYATISFSEKGTYSFTVASQNVEKTVSIDVTVPSLESIRFASANHNDRLFLPSYALAGVDLAAKVLPTPSNAPLDLAYELVDNTAQATARIENNVVHILAQEEGTFTLRVYDRSLGEASAIEKTVTVLPHTAEGMARMLDVSTFQDNSGNVLDFVKNEGENGGTFQVETYDYAGNGTYVIEEVIDEGTQETSLVLKLDMTFDSEDYSLTEYRLYDEYNTLRLSVEDDYYYDKYTTYFFMQ